MLSSPSGGRRTDQDVGFFSYPCILGGIIVILPTIVLFLAFKWLFGFVADAIRPLTNLLVNNITLPDRYGQKMKRRLLVGLIRGIPERFPKGQSHN